MFLPLVVQIQFIPFCHLKPETSLGKQAAEEVAPIERTLAQKDYAPRRGFSYATLHLELIDKTSRLSVFGRTFTPPSLENTPKNPALSMFFLWPNLDWQ
jgi:hypothetical protein